MESEDSLLERLKSHQNAFESLLTLIPGRLYHHEESNTQWNKKKQTKEEAKRAKRAKLDPDSSHTAADIQNEKALLAQQQQKSKDESKTDQKMTKKPKGVTKEPQKPKGKISGDNFQEPKQNLVSSSEELAAEEELYPIESHQESKHTQPLKQHSSIIELKAKLHSRIEQLRANRKAPGSGVEGAPKNRDAILDARRKKKEAKQERMINTDKDRKGEIRQETEATEQGQSQPHDGLAFSRITFAGGEEFDAVSGEIKKLKKRKAMDVTGALKHVEAKKQKLQEMDDVKRSKIEESDSWRKAFNQVRGEKVRDDEKLLKKAVKRQERQKKKSEKEWSERIEKVRHNKEQRQKKREANIQARKEVKKTKGSKKKRPGFEGSIRAKKRK